MKHVKRLTPVFTLPLIAFFLFASAAATTTGTTYKSAGGPLNAVAMDGPRVAYDVGNATMLNGPGNKVLVWNVLTGKTTKVSGKITDQADITSTGHGVRELAIAGQRVAWIINQGGNSESDDALFTSLLAKPTEKKLVSARRTGEVMGVLTGNWIGGLVGSESLLAVNRWATDATGTVTRVGLSVIGAYNLRRIVSGSSVLLAQSADAGRIAVLRSDGSVGLYSAAGRLLRTVTPPSAQQVALQGNYLVVLTKTRTLAVYNFHTGALLKTLLVRGRSPQNLDVQANLAVYTVARELHVVHLKSGKDRVLATMSHGIKFAQIEAPGVVYAGNLRQGTKDPVGMPLGTLAYLPFARVAAAVS
jgi:hypothetical protein